VNEEQSITTRARVISACELLVGAAIVIGHNVYHVLPNEVPILFLLGLASVRVRDGRWSAIGFKRPKSWRRIVSIALGAAVVRIVLGDFVIVPLASHFWPEIHAPAGATEITGNIKVALVMLSRSSRKKESDESCAAKFALKVSGVELAPRLEKFHFPEEDLAKTSSGCSIFNLVKCRECEKMRLIQLTPTSIDFACKKGREPNAGSSAMEKLLARAPPAKSENSR